MLHHISIKTANIHRAIAFYECLGFAVSERFTTGFTLACWLTGQDCRLELMQIPEPQPPIDTFHDEHYVGYYHLSLDVTSQAPDLPTWLQLFAAQLAANQDFVMDMQVLLPPRQQQIGSSVYEVAFIADADNLPIELLHSV